MHPFIPNSYQAVVGRKEQPKARAPERVQAEEERLSLPLAERSDQ
jgi:hypothetical protein